MSLALKRRPSESVTIDHPSGPIVVRVDRTVKLDIEAPRDVRIRRSELADEPPKEKVA